MRPGLAEDRHKGGQVGGISLGAEAPAVAEAMPFKELTVKFAISMDKLRRILRGV